MPLNGLPLEQLKFAFLSCPIILHKQLTRCIFLMMNNLRTNVTVGGLVSIHEENVVIQRELVPRLISDPEASTYISGGRSFFPVCDLRHHYSRTLRIFAWEDEKVTTVALYFPYNQICRV